MTSYDKHYYGGSWHVPGSTESAAVLSSATEAEIARVPRGTADDVDQAVKAARQGFEFWSRVSVEDRAQWLEKLAAAMKARVPQLAEAIAHEVGTAVGYATKVQVEFPIMMIGMNAKFIREAKLEEELGNSLILKEPIGVVGCITPWNYPLHQIVCKIAPALAAGCTVVLKPAEMAPLSAFILADAAHEVGLPAGVNNCMQNSGQTCSAWTRMLVPRARHDEAVELAKAQLAKLTLGDPFDKNTRLGPLASEGQRDSVLGFIEQGKKEGATVVAGGGRPAEPAKGYYVEPTIFANVNNAMAIAQEEIFGPVLVIIPYDTEAEAIAIANDSPYGLSGGVWAGTPERALGVARQLRTGQVDINGGRFNVLAPFGGYKKSGIGREIGPLALEEFFQLKSIQR